MSSDFMPAVTICSDFRAQEGEICHYFYFSPSIFHEVMGPDAMILLFLMFSFKPALTLFLHPHQGLFGSSSLSAIRVVSSAYPRVLMFLPPILIPACNSSSPAFLKMCSVYRLSKHGGVAVQIESLVVPRWKGNKPVNDLAQDLLRFPSVPIKNWYTMTDSEETSPENNFYVRDTPF